MITKANVRKIVKNYFAGHETKYREVLINPAFDTAVMKCRTKDEVEAICFRYFFSYTSFTPSEYASATAEEYARRPRA